ncbi:MAG TPA: hypothetical protein VFR09_02445 [Alphaproteobacteria bacterium]|nr:hypothetical protein [Alphaproteobacteria bacterium]
MSSRVYNNSARRKARQIACLIALGLVLTGCGKKPGHVDPPLGADETAFPRTYPDISTDPKDDTANPQ